MEWARSTRCDSGDCLEVGHHEDMVGMRDSKDPDGPQLWFDADVFREFIAAVKTGDL